MRRLNQLLSARSSFESAGRVTLLDETWMRQPDSIRLSMRPASCSNSACRSGWARMGRTPARRKLRTVCSRSTKTPCGNSISMNLRRSATLMKAPFVQETSISGCTITSAQGKVVSATLASRKVWVR